jgi:alanine dehydrogenase
MALLLTHTDVQKLLDMRELIDAMERAQVQYSSGRTVLPMRSSVVLPQFKGDMELMPGFLEEDNVFGVKVLQLRFDNPSVGLPIVHATILIHDPPTGRLLAIVEGAGITAARTAAVSGVATRYLARPDAAKVGMIGAGRQARTHLWAMLTVRPVRSVRVYDSKPEARGRFKEEMEARFGIPIEAVATAEDAVRDADILVLSTTSSTPVVSSSWLPDGLHINSIASFAPDAREMDTDTIRRAKLVVDSREAAFHEAGDILIPLAEGAIGRDHVHAEVGEIASGAREGRTSAEELTVYKSLGIAIQDMAAAKLLYEKARNMGVGTEVDM